jgi:mono/diheme cytochrome c family protein
LTKAKLRSALGVLALGTLPLSGCTDWAGYDLDYLWGYIPALSTLRGSVAYDPYELPRLPAENTIPVASPEGISLPDFPQTALDSAAATLSNPLQPTPEVLSVGKRLYLNQCAMCHGANGGGNGTVVGPGKFPFAPAINGQAGTPRPVEYVFAIITTGRGLMPPQGYKLSYPEQWALATYVEYLQANPENDIPVAPWSALPGGVENNPMALPRVEPVEIEPEPASPAGRGAAPATEPISADSASAPTPR